IAWLRRSGSRPTRSAAPWPIARPIQWFDEHPARRHRSIPGMINDVITPVRPGDNGVVPGTDQLAGHGMKNARALLIARIRIRPQHVIGHRVIHPVRFILPAPSAVKTIIPAFMFPDEWAFQRVPIIA